MVRGGRGKWTVFRGACFGLAVDTLTPVQRPVRSKEKQKCRFAESFVLTSVVCGSGGGGRLPPPVSAPHSRGEKVGEPQLMVFLFSLSTSGEQLLRIWPAYDRAGPYVCVRADGVGNE